MLQFSCGYAIIRLRPQGAAVLGVKMTIWNGNRRIYGNLVAGELACDFENVGWVADTGEFSLGAQAAERNLVLFSPQALDQMQADCLSELDDSERLAYVIGLFTGRPTHCDKCCEIAEDCQELQGYDVALDGSHFSYVCRPCAFELDY